MKKLLKITLTLLFAATLLTGCGSKNVEYLKDMKKPDKFLTLGQYKGIEVSAKKTEITDEYMDRYIEFMLSQLATNEDVVGRPVQEGDLVNIDFAGFMDGEQFEGGTSQGYNLEIGSHSFIDGFEDGLIGANIGDKLSLNLTFPENYGKQELAGKAVVFEVTVNSIAEEKIPELTDELVGTFGFDDCSTVEDLREKLRKEFDQDATTAYEQNVKEQIAKAVTDNAQFITIPEKMTERHLSMLKNKLTSDATAAGMQLKDYLLTYYGLTADTYEEGMRVNAEESAKQMMVFQAIAVKEGIKTTQQDINDSMAADAAGMGISVEDYKASLDMPAYEEYVLSNKVLEYLIGEAVITAPAEVEEE